MATVERREAAAASIGPADPGIAPNQVRPIAAWAWIGFGFLTFAAYLVLKWLISGEAHRVGSGPTPLPTAMKICLGVQQWGLAAAALALLYFRAIRPRLRTGEWTFDGLLLLTFALMWWSDPMYNYFALGFNYNAWFVNLGSWIGGVPGWMSPHPDRTPQPLIWLPAVYTCAFYAMVLIACAIMRRLRARRPTLSMPSVWAITFVPMMVFGTIWEASFMVMGSHQYASSIRGFALNPGKYFEFPIYQGITASILYTTWAAMRYFRDDHGRTFPERGIERLRVGPKARAAVRFFAISGATTFIYFIGYHIPNALIALEGSAWPKSVQERSYFTSGLCGPGTDTACPGRNIPFPRGDKSLRVGPDGKLVVPRGTQLPQPVKVRTR
jgi:Spirocyclase AveC-like